MALTNKLTAIGDAIREKTGGASLLTLDEMPAQIRSIEGGSGGFNDEIILHGNMDYCFANERFDVILDKYSDNITTDNITSASHMFANNTKLENIPINLELYVYPASPANANAMFENCYRLKNMNGFSFDQSGYAGGYSFYLNDTTNMFNKCYMLKSIPVNELPEGKSTFGNAYFTYDGSEQMFNKCYALRDIPEGLLCCVNWIKGANQIFNDCWMVNSLNNIGYNVEPSSEPITTNLFTYTFANLMRCKSIMFASLNEYNLSNQVIDLRNVGVYNEDRVDTLTDSEMLRHIDLGPRTWVYDAEDYNLYKDDENYTTENVEFSRYNYTAAVDTLNNLPRTIGTNNMVIFSAASGRGTDDGGIELLLEEDIAVAIDNGWTVSLV